MNPPILRPDLPTYPVHIQVCRVTTSTGSPANLYYGYTEQVDPSALSPRDREACYVLDLNWVGLGPGYYVCRLVGSYTSLPLYVTHCCTGTVTDPPTVIDTSTSQSQSKTHTTVTITGTNFTGVSTTVVFNKTAVGTVTTGTATSLTITFTSLPTSTGTLKVAVRTVNGPAVSTSTITAVANTTPIQITSTSHGLSTNNRVEVTGTGIATIDTLTWTITRIDNNTFSLDTSTAAGTSTTGRWTSTNTGTITSITNATPRVVTSTNHGLNTGDTVYITGVATLTALNTVWDVTRTSANTYSLDTSIATGGTDTTGTWQKMLPVSEITFPVIAVTTTSQVKTVGTFTITGTGFSVTPANNVITQLNLGATATVTSATTTTLTGTFSVQPNIGDLTVTLSVNGDSYGPTEVAQITGTDTYDASITWVATFTGNLVVDCTGGSGKPANGSVGVQGGGAGGGGDFARKNAYAVVAGNSYTIHIAAGSGVDKSYFDNAATVAAYDGGIAVGATGGPAGPNASSVGDTVRGGGAGGNGRVAAGGGGGGGGEAASFASAGNNGSNSVSGTGGAGGTGTGGADGGAGGTGPAGNGAQGSSPGGGSGGGSTGGNGGTTTTGRVTITR